MKTFVGFKAGGEFTLEIERRGKTVTQTLNVEGEPAD